MLRLRQILVWAAFLALVAATCWGIYSARLFSQAIWTPVAWRRLVIFSCLYGAWSGLAIGLARRWFLPLTAAGALIWTVLSIGLAAPAAVGLFLFSCLVLGRLILADSNRALAIVLGMCLFLAAIGMAVHFPVNYPLVYLALFVVPLVWRPDVTLECLKECIGLVRPMARGSRLEYAAGALLGFVMLAHLLTALTPEVSADALAMHFVVPWSVYFHHYWAFDFQRIVWALMPMGGDWLYTGVFMLGGESATKLLNFAALALVGAMLYSALRQWLPRVAAHVSVTLFVSSPLTQAVTGSAFIENFQAVFLFAAVVALWKYRETGSKAWLFTSAITLGSGMATKFGSIAFALPLMVLAAAEVWRRRQKGVALAAIGLLLLFAAPPYLTAYIKSGNPVFPFANDVFKSPGFDSRISFLNGRYLRAGGPGTLFDIVFNTHRYLESRDGAVGLQYFLLAPLCVLLLGRGWLYPGWTALGIGVPFVILSFSAQSYARYLYSALPLLSVLIGLILSALRSVDRWLYRCLLTASVVTIAMNVYLLPASGWYFGDFFMNPLNGGEALPVRELVRYLNDRHPGESVAMFETTEVAGLKGDAYLDMWHNYRYSRRVHEKPSALGFLRLAQQLGIRYFVAPRAGSGIPIVYPFIESFLSSYTEPVYSYGAYSIRKLAANLPVPTDSEVAASLPAPGPCASDSARVVDDLDGAIQYRGTWAHEIIFAAAFRGSVSYADTEAGAGFELVFTGREITWVYALAPNRGRADVEIDGVHAGTVDLYSPTVHWQAKSTFQTTTGDHVFTVKVQPPTSYAVAGTYVDLDCLVVR